jgi:hypothetical protein
MRYTPAAAMRPSFPLSGSAKNAGINHFDSKVLDVIRTLRRIHDGEPPLNIGYGSLVISLLRQRLCSQSVSHAEQDLACHRRLPLRGAMQD